MPKHHGVGVPLALDLIFALLQEPHPRDQTGWVFGVSMCAIARGLSRVGSLRPVLLAKGRGNDEMTPLQRVVDEEVYPKPSSCSGAPSNVRSGSSVSGTPTGARTWLLRHTTTNT